VTLDNQNVDGLAGLQTDQSSRRLNQIDRIRARGVGDHISLPQLVVCGDQSAGKSSVLEGITGIPFPRQDGVFTRFATEIILRHQPGTNRITAEILPSPLRTEDERHRMASFKRQLGGIGDLPQVIQEASALMEIRDHATADPGALAFAADVLRLEVVGDTGLHLTVVDLPGLISVSENPDDMELVANLVDGYLESSGTIILTVVPASNDIDTQSIIQRARKFDKEEVRTVGIITKPDLINKGTESRVAALAENLDRVKLKLGVFLLKNPSPAELGEGMSLAKRQQQEARFFNSSLWAEQHLDKSRIGIARLRTFLQQLIADHIDRELPKVRKEVEALLTATERQLVQIGPERSSVGQMRVFLTQMSMDFYTLTKDAVDGNYLRRDASFFPAAPEIGTRLRAQGHLENERFANRMRIYAAKRKIRTKKEPAEEESEQSTSSDASRGSNDGDQILLTKRQ
jgi:GTPase SAR1 family protein